MRLYRAVKRTIWVEELRVQGAFSRAVRFYRAVKRTSCSLGRFRGLGFRVRMRAGVRLGGPEKRTGSLRVVIPPGAGFRA